MSASAWSPESLRVVDGSVGASETDSPVTNEFHITGPGSIQMVLDIRVTAATVAAGITAKLQTTSSIDGVTDVWENSKTVAITAAGRFLIRLHPADDTATAAPLRAKGRLVISSGAGDSATISHVLLLQPE